MKKLTWCLVGCSLALMMVLSGCVQEGSRLDAIPDDAVKITPETDILPPILQVSGWGDPIPMEGPINTAGGEDSAFITPDGKTFYFFFTPDVSVPANEQLTDGYTGIWWSHWNQGLWSEPERVVLTTTIGLDGAQFVLDDTLWFASARLGNFGELDYYIAELVDGEWKNWQNAGQLLNAVYDIGELHISRDGQLMYCDGYGSSSSDLFVLEANGSSWDEPVALPAPINTDEFDESRPYVNADGSELWYTSTSRLGYPGPAIFRSIRLQNGSWGEPVEVVSQFAGEPSLDDDGNLYFTHHFFDGQMNMIEADIYVCYAVD